MTPERGPATPGTRATFTPGPAHAGFPAPAPLRGACTLGAGKGPRPAAALTCCRPRCGGLGSPGCEAPPVPAPPPPAPRSSASESARPLPGRAPAPAPALLRGAESRGPASPGSSPAPRRDWHCRHASVGGAIARPRRWQPAWAACGQVQQDAGRCAERGKGQRDPSRDATGPSVPPQPARRPEGAGVRPAPPPQP